MVKLQRPLLGILLWASIVAAEDVPAFDPSCPSECQCDHDEFVGTNVRCHYRNLTEVPSGLPTSTAWLFLNGNDIRTLPPSTFAHMPALQILDLQDNLIERLPEPSDKHENAFHGLRRLETLRLSRNPLSNSLSASSFNGLLSLKTLKLLGTDWRCPVPEFCSTSTTYVYMLKSHSHGVARSGEARVSAHRRLSPHHTCAQGRWARDCDGGVLRMRSEEGSRGARVRTQEERREAVRR